jgi:hypothetical protein
MHYLRQFDVSLLGVMLGCCGILVRVPMCYVVVHVCVLCSGRGAYGSVFKALDKSTGDVVAIKVISTTDSDADDLERIHKEVMM